MNKTLQEVTEHFVPKRKKKRSAPMSWVARVRIKQASPQNKHAFWKWKENKRPQERDNPLFVAMKRAKSALRRKCRIALASRRQDNRQRILDIKDSPLALG